MNDKTNKPPDNSREPPPPPRQTSLPLSWDEQPDSKTTRPPAGREKQKNRAQYKKKTEDTGKNKGKTDDSESKPRQRISLVNTVPDTVSPGVQSDQAKIIEVEDNSPISSDEKPESSVETQKETGNKAEKYEISSSPRDTDKMMTEQKNHNQETNEKFGRYHTAPDSTAPSLGDILAQARQKRQLTIADVVRKTRIPKEFIENIETEDYEKLPPPVYARSHIAQLCREYSLEPKHCLRAYEQTRNDQPAESEKKNKKMRLVINRDNDDSGVVSYSPGTSNNLLDDQESIFSRLPRLAIIFATGLLLLIILSALLIQQYRNWRMRQPVPQETHEAEPAVPAEPTVNLEEFIPPQQVPMRELPIPEE